MNAVHCNVCDTTIVSEYTHDFKGCACPDNVNGEGTRVFVDGGNSYRKRSWSHDADFTEVDA